MSAEEEAETRAKWAEAAAQPVPDPFDVRLAQDPMLQALIAEIAEAKKLTEAEVKTSLKAKWEANGGI